MQLLVLVLRDSEKMEELLLKLSASGIGGATVMDCHGMGELLMRSQGREDIPFFDLFSNLLDADGTEGKLMFTVLTDEKAEMARCVIRDSIGGLDKPNTGIMFGVPLTFAEGIRE